MEALTTLPVNYDSLDPFAAAEIEKNERRYEILNALLTKKARKEHLHFINYMWNNPSEPFVIGRHTRMICEQIDDAITRFSKGHSVFKVITVPFRHGKAFQVDTPVLTITGWKRHGELQPGHYVFDPMGQPAMVEAITPMYLHARYLLTFENGEEFWTTPEHEWPIQYQDRTGRWFNQGFLETRRIRFRTVGRNNPNLVFIERGPACNQLAIHNNGTTHPGSRIRVTAMRAMPGTHHVNCIQVQGGEYLIGKTLIPTHNSEIISRKLPAMFLGRFPDGKVLMTGHTASLSVGYSKESRNLLDSQKFRNLFPGIRLNPLDASASHWKLHGANGEVFACGLGGSMAGQGYTLGIVDDYCRSRADAESPTMRERMWSSFTNDFLTRRAPRSITLVTATTWHIDDVIGRIKQRMKEDPYFPKFEFVSMPAFSDEYEEGILFPERFNREWYDEQRAALGEYGTASLLQCSPTAQGGNIIKIDNVKKIPLTEFPDIPYHRVWDLAHTEKQRASSDPDYTSGTLLACRRKPGAPRQWQMFVKDVVRFRLDAPKRDNRILNITAQDGAYVKVAIESSIDSKDAYATLRDLLLGQRVVLPVKGKGDKVVRASALEPMFEAGDVFVPEGAPWIPAWLEELASFPSGAHDDQVDNLSSGFIIYNKLTGATSTGLYGI